MGGRYRYIYEQHLNSFTRATLTRLVRPRFAIIAMRSSHFNPVVIWQVTPEVLKRQGKSTPFDFSTSGTALPGQVKYTLVAGTVAYQAA